MDDPKPAHPADHPDPYAGRRPRGRAPGARLRWHQPAGQGPDQPLRRLLRRGLPQEVAGADPAQPRRHPRADGRVSTSTRASSRSSTCASRRQARCSRRCSRRRRTPAPS
ncbi:hypothetical protein [Nocardioides convexus]|uniref:hypothetical protein n=1 Tax=Nocardioides convexus TaxID=2712224 RepID=UPI00241820C0|nr:hypothetical protein [Nocardioides convexus]